MKIAGYRVDPVHVPADVPNGGRHIIVRLLTDEGLEGVAYASRIPREYLKTIASIAENMLEQLVVGQDPLESEALHGKLFRRGMVAGLETRAAAGIEAALWDLKGKAVGLPVYRLLGGSRDRVPVYASWRVEPRGDLEDLARCAAEHVDNGFRSMKTHVGGLDQERLLTHVRVLRETVGPDIDIMLDVNQRWTLKQALNNGRALEQYRPYWIEDPVSVEDYDGMRQLTETLSTRICAGETYRLMSSFRSLMANRSVDIAMVDQDMGLTGFMKVAHMAEIYELPVVPHASTEILAHLIAALPNGLTVEYYPSVMPLVGEPMAVMEGMLVLPQKPGLGLEFDEDLVQKYRLN